MRVLLDASSLIALAQVDGLHILEKLFKEVYITPEIEEEALRGSSRDVGEIKARLGKTIKTLKPRTKYFKELKGIDEGERSILGYAKEKGDTLLILDEVEARAIAQAENINYTGTLGLIVHCHRQGKIAREEAVSLVKKLSKSSFRMTTDLYDWAMVQLE